MTSKDRQRERERERDFLQRIFANCAPGQLKYQRGESLGTKFIGTWRDDHTDDQLSIELPPKSFLPPSSSLLAFEANNARKNEIPERGTHSGSRDQLRVEKTTKEGTIEFYNAKFPLARRFLFPRDRPTERAVGSFVSFQTQAAFIDSFRDNKT